MADKKRNLKLWKRLEFLAGGKQEAIAPKVGRRQSTVARWGKAIRAGEMPPGGKKTIGIIEDAVARLEGEETDYERGYKAALEDVKESVEGLRPTVPPEPLSDPGDLVGDASASADDAERKNGGREKSGSQD